MKKNNGFTLSEVLITLVIIGVIAALTIPNLYVYYQKQQYIVELKKVYTEISQALRQLMADESVDRLSLTESFTCQEGEVCPSEENISRVGNNFLKKYFKVIKDCASEDPSSCFAESYKTISGEGADRPHCLYSIITVGGASICLIQIADIARPSIFFIDTNGLKPPNTVGRDLFRFSVYYDGSLDESVTPECKKGIENSGGALCNNGSSSAYELRAYKAESPPCSENTYGYGCFGKILNDNWKMDY